MSIDIYPDKQMLEDGKMVIVDIRTEDEWCETGILSNCTCLTFFDERGSYDIDIFLKGLDTLGGKEQEIGFICRTGSRTAQVANFLHAQGYNVKSLSGGIMKLMREGYELVPFKK